MHIYICIHTRYACMHVFMYAHMSYASMSVCLSVCLYANVHVSLCACETLTNLRRNVCCMYGCMHVRITYVCTHT